ncbi:MAG TPA: surface-adhesin E family protein [Allosphingosinicella sp.]|nr:surface-adhesin E family protein [Allosphingosinicella sp.]
MIALTIAAMLAQQAPPPAPDPCNAVPRPAALPAGCTQWRLLRETPEGSTAVDPAPVRRDGDIVEIVNRAILGEAMRDGARSFNSRIRLDCRRRTSLIMHIVAYTGEGVKIFDGPAAPAQPQQVMEGTPYGDMIALFCPR